MSSNIKVLWKGFQVEVDVTDYVPSRPAPMAQTPDCPGYDDEGDAGEIEFEVVDLTVDCPETIADAFDMNASESLADLVFAAMESEDGQG
jgi:hypothetical protein